MFIISTNLIEIGIEEIDNSGIFKNKKISSDPENKKLSVRIFHDHLI